MSQPTHACPVCGNLFLPSRPWQKYDKQACRLKAFALARKNGQDQLGGYYRLRYAAERIVVAAYRDGVISLPACCEECGAKPSKKRGIAGHHDDYAKPLALRFLCHRCHKRWHMSHKAANGAVLIYLSIKKRERSTKRVF